MNPRHLSMPRLSQDMTQGRIVKWLKQEGERVREGEALVSIETDKAVTDVQSPASGMLRRILVEPEQDAEVGTPLAVLADAEDDIEGYLRSLTLPSGKPDAAVRTTAALPGASASPRPAETGPAGAKAPAGGRQPVSPAARRVARELGVDVSHAVATGAGGLVTESDVRALAAGGGSAATLDSTENIEVIPLTGIRRRIAERLSLSRRTAADVTTIVDVDMTEVAADRATTRCSYTSYVLWAVGHTLPDHRILNATLDGDRILVKRDINIGVAASLEGGLVVPVIRSADRKSVEEISREIDEVATRARESRVEPEDVSGGTFTVTNSGAFGSLMFTPIINYPEVAVLGMGKVADTPVARDGRVVVRKLMYLCLSYDHRVVDGAPAVQFLDAVKRRLESYSAAG